MYRVLQFQKVFLVATALVGMVTSCTNKSASGDDKSTADTTARLDDFNHDQLTRLSNLQIVQMLDLNPGPVETPDSIKRLTLEQIDVDRLLYRRGILMTRLNMMSSDTIPLPENPEYTTVNAELRILDVVLSHWEMLSTCQRAPLLQDVGFCEPGSGMIQDTLNLLARSVGVLQWNYQFQNFGPNDFTAGKQGKRWGTGFLIGRDTFVTAGHCLVYANNGEMPLRGNRELTASELAQLMHVQFNYEISNQFPRLPGGFGGTLRSDTINFPVIEIIEHRPESGVDFAILKLGAVNDVFPGDRFGRLQISPPLNGLMEDTVCIIQHPDQLPKKFGRGYAYFGNEPFITYTQISTGGGSSGSPVISCRTNKVVGVHVNGDCAGATLTNKAIAIDMIRNLMMPAH